jgi:hypothetical protein
VDIDPVVGEQIVGADHQRDGQKIAVVEPVGLDDWFAAADDPAASSRIGAELMTCAALILTSAPSSRRGECQRPLPSGAELLEAVRHQHMVARVALT